MADLRSELAAALADRYALERELGRGGMVLAAGRFPQLRLVEDSA